MPVVSVVVRGEAGPGSTGEGLSSVLASSHPAVEVLVAGGRPPAARAGVRHLPSASLDAAVREATGAYVVFVSAGEVVPADAWPAMVAALEETGSDLAIGGRRGPEVRPWTHELTARRLLRQTVDSLPLATVDLTLDAKMFRTSSWRASGASLDNGPGDEPALLAALLAATTFDVLPRVASERPASGASVPIHERPRFRPERVAARVDALLEAAATGPEGWRELVAAHLLPPLYVDAVGGGEPYLEALRHRLPALLEGLDLAAVPVEPRLGAWAALHGTWQDVALVQDLVADNPHGLPTRAGLVLLPDGLSTRVPDSWRALTDADRRPRSFVDGRVEVVDGRVRVRGASFVEYVEQPPVPRVSLHGPDGQAHDLEVVRRRDRRTNEWAARAWEDRADAGWEASGDADRVLAGSSSQWTVQVLVGDECFSEEVRIARPRGTVTELDTVSFAGGVLTVAGSTRERDDLHGHLSGPRGSGGDVTLRTSGGRSQGQVPLTTTSFGASARLPVGRYGLGLASTSWSAALLREPLELVDDRQRVDLAQDADGPAVVVAPPLRGDERGAYAQQQLRSGVYAAPGGLHRDTVLLETFRGKSIGDNPGAVARELLSRDVGLDLVWVVDDPAVTVPAGTRAVARRTAEWHDLLGHARGYVGNAGAPYWFGKAAGQFHLQTWHGTPLKRIGEDRGPGDFSTWRHRRRMAAQAAGWDAMVSPSPYCSDIFRRAFRFEGPMLEVGYPRNDVLLTDRGALRRTVRDRLGLTDEDRVVLYAPTWREYLGVRTGKPVYVDPERLTAGMPDTVLLVRGHYNSTGQRDLFEGHPRVHDVTRYPDVAELFLAADALVTDYSSVMFDFVLTDRPMVLLVPDLEQYRDVERGFYFDIESRSPGPLVSDTDEVVDVLLGPDEHASARSSFRAEFCPWDDGRASARVVDDLLSRW